MANWKDTLKVLGKLAPTIATVAGGPLAGTAVSAIEGAFGITPKTTDATQRENDIAEAIAGASPEQLVALRKADDDFKVQMAQLGYKNQADLEALAVQDRDSARKREADVKDWTPRVLAYAVVFASLGIGYGVLYHKLAADSATIGMIAGFIFREAASVLSYYFGSSRESAQQAALLAQSTPPAK